jgi:hypothetical protein
MSINKYYSSLVNVVLNPKVWTPIQEAAWRGALLGKRKIKIKTSRDTDMDESCGSKIEDEAYKIGQEMSLLGFVDIKKEDKSSIYGFYYIVKGYFPEILVIKNDTGLFRTYLRSIQRVIEQIQNLNNLENECCRLLDKIFYDAQIATNKGQRWIKIKNTHKTRTNGTYDPDILKIITEELALIPYIKFKVVNIRCAFWDEEIILVWNWRATNLSKDTKLYKKDLPDNFCIELETCDYIE